MRRTELLQEVRKMRFEEQGTGYSWWMTHMGLMAGIGLCLGATPIGESGSSILHSPRR